MPVRGLTVVALALPLAGLALLSAQPDLDVTWEHHPAHFWLVLEAAGLSAALAYATSATARRRGDARVFLVSLAFLAAAGFLALHALATPRVLLDGPNTGFAMATPVGLLIAGIFAAASSGDLDRARADAVMRHASLLRGGLLAVMALWAAVSLASVPPLDDPAAPERLSGPLLALAAAGLALYAIAVIRYLQLYRRRPSVLAVRMAAACALLAEAMLAIAVARNWQATWWEWHLLMLAAFVIIAWTAHREWHEERFSDLYLEDTSNTREISVLFADLEGFTRFSECHEPREVSAMLNAYFEVAIPPIVERYGGDVDRLIGDAVMVVFNRNGDQPDHALRAASAALAIQMETARLADANPGWPRFRVGINSGEATIAVLGAAGARTQTAIGDTVNVAARLEGRAPVGGVAVGEDTARRLPGGCTVLIGAVQVKGREEPVEVHQLLHVNQAPSR